MFFKCYVFYSFYEKNPKKLKIKKKTLINSNWKEKSNKKPKKKI